MNLYEGIKSKLNESNFGIEFEKSIPHCMRYKEYDIIPITDDFGRETGESLYWITQEPFDDLDLMRFRDVFVDTGYSDAYVTVRDLSSYDLNSDKDEGVLVHITKDGKIDSDSYMKIVNDRGWFNEAEELTEAKKFIPGVFIDDIVDPYDIGLTEEDLKKNLSLKFTGYENMTKSEHEDFPECNAVLNFDIYYKNTKVGSRACFGSTEDKPEEYFDQEIQNTIDNPLNTDFSKVKLG